jgi:hypothetical protein
MTVRVAPPVVFVVHLLHEGVTLCYMPGTPNTWPEDHRWVGRGHEDRVTCRDCRRALEIQKGKQHGS